MLNGTKSLLTSRCRRAFSKATMAASAPWPKFTPPLTLQAHVAISTWKEDYDANRPQSSLGNITPNEFAMKMAPEKQAT